MSLQIFGKEVISYNLTEKNDVMNKLHSFTFEPQKGGGRVQQLMWSGPSPKRGLFYVTSKGGNIDFPPPSPPYNFVPMFEVPKENNKHPNFEWRG